MARAQTQILHESKLDTILMVEKAIIDTQSLPNPNPTLLEYLEASGKITVDKRKIIYTGS